MPFVSCAFTKLDNQQRNKPKEPPKAPERAPFFLPTLAGVETRFVVQDKEKQKASRKAITNAEGVFVQKLLQESKDSDCKCALFT
jgi:U3 small nucleolar RNA-associated protein 21